MAENPAIGDIQLITLTEENDAPQLLIEAIREALRADRVASAVLATACGLLHAAAAAAQPATLSLNDAMARAFERTGPFWRRDRRGRSIRPASESRRSAPIPK